MRGEIHVSWKNIVVRSNVVTAERLCHLQLLTVKVSRKTLIYSRNNQGRAIADSAVITWRYDFVILRFVPIR